MPLLTPRPSQGREGNPPLYDAPDYAQVKPGYASIQPKEGKGRERKETRGFMTLLIMPKFTPRCTVQSTGFRPRSRPHSTLQPSQVQLTRSSFTPPFTPFYPPYTTLKIGIFLDLLTPFLSHFLFCE